MSVHGWLLWGFVGSVVLDVLLMASHAVGATRLSLPFVLGTMLTRSRDRARLYGFALHLAVGWIAALVYVAAFQWWGEAGALRGALVGVVHALVVLLGLFPLLPGLHPRMASETHGPDPARQLEPPGLLGLHYGASTPIAIVAAHAVFGAILGGFYRV